MFLFFICADKYNQSDDLWSTHCNLPVTEQMLELLVPQLPCCTWEMRHPHSRQLWKNFPSPPEQGCVHPCLHPRPLLWLGCGKCGNSPSLLVTWETKWLQNEFDGKNGGIADRGRALCSVTWAGIFHFCCHSRLVVSSHLPESGSPLENDGRGNRHPFVANLSNSGKGQN